MGAAPVVTLPNLSAAVTVTSEGTVTLPNMGATVTLHASSVAATYANNFEGLGTYTAWEALGSYGRWETLP